MFSITILSITYSFSLSIQFHFASAVFFVSVLYFLVVHFISFVTAILSVFVCKPCASTCFHPRARKEVFCECPQCGHSYFDRRKLPNCEKCGYLLGGTNESAPKKPKWNLPRAVFFVGSSHFSCKTSTKDDCCFV